MPIFDLIQKSENQSKFDDKTQKLIAEVLPQLEQGLWDITEEQKDQARQLRRAVLNALFPAVVPKKPGWARGAYVPGTGFVTFEVQWCPEMRDKLRELFQDTGLSGEAIDEMVKHFHEHGLPQGTITQDQLIKWVPPQELMGLINKLGDVEKEINKVIFDATNIYASDRKNNFQRLINLRELELTYYEDETRGGTGTNKMYFKMTQDDKETNADLLNFAKNRSKLEAINMRFMAAKLDAIGRIIERFPFDKTMSALIEHIKRMPPPIHSLTPEQEVEKLRFLALTLSEVVKVDEHGKTKEIKPDSSGNIIFEGKKGRKVKVQVDGQGFEVENYGTGNWKDEDYVGKSNETIRKAAQKRADTYTGQQAARQEALAKPEEIEGTRLTTESVEQIITPAIRDALDTGTPLKVQIIRDSARNIKIIQIVSEKIWFARALGPAMIYREGQGETAKYTFILPQTASQYRDTLRGVNLTLQGFLDSINAANGQLTAEQIELLDQLAKDTDKGGYGLIELIPGSTDQYKLRSGIADVALQGVSLDIETQDKEKEILQALETVRHEFRHSLEEASQKGREHNTSVIVTGISGSGSGDGDDDPKKRRKVALATVVFLEKMLKYPFSLINERVKEAKNKAYEEAKKKGEELDEDAINKILLEEYVKDELIRREIVGWLTEPKLIARMIDDKKIESWVHAKVLTKAEGELLKIFIDPSYQKAIQYYSKGFEEGCEIAKKDIAGQLPPQPAVTPAMAAQDNRGKDRGKVLGKAVGSPKVSSSPQAGTRAMAGAVAEHNPVGSSVQTSAMNANSIDDIQYDDISMFTYKLGNNLKKGGKKLEMGLEIVARKVNGNMWRFIARIPPLAEDPQADSAREDWTACKGILKKAESKMDEGTIMSILVRAEKKRHDKRAYEIVASFGDVWASMAPAARKAALVRIKQALRAAKHMKDTGRHVQAFQRHASKLHRTVVHMIKREVMVGQHAKPMLSKSFVGADFMSAHSNGRTQGPPLRPSKVVHTRPPLSKYARPRTTAPLLNQGVRARVARRALPSWSHVSTGVLGSLASTSPGC
ncbi:MAG: hypothetical protein HQL13_05600, partial [Candidatus Omnitrophica bacterium]|nr:hypothetical protein [Candidatus Omnitrophota bacterium]